MILYDMTTTAGQRAAERAMELEKARLNLLCVCDQAGAEAWERWAQARLEQDLAQQHGLIHYLRFAYDLASRGTAPPGWAMNKEGA